MEEMLFPLIEFDLREDSPRWTFLKNSCLLMTWNKDSVQRLLQAQETDDFSAGLNTYRDFMKDLSMWCYTALRNPFARIPWGTHVIFFL